MTPLQQKEYQLLGLFLDICHQLDLRYYLVCGSALGAVKYKGFIPWDDDVDVAMPRGDYQRFLSQAQALLPDGFFLQDFHTDPAFPQIYSKLRDSNTAFIEKSAAHLPIHHGIYLDIFPLDGYPQTLLLQWQLEWKKRWYQRMLGAAFAEPKAWKSRMLYRVMRLLGFHKRTAQIATRYDVMIRQYPLENSKLWCNHGSWQGKREYAPREQYGEGTMATFEGLAVRIPSKFYAYLTQKYGDYGNDPPLEAQTGHHYHTVCDTEKSYVNYMHRKDSGL